MLTTKREVVVENNKRPTQANKIIRYMKDFGSITQLQALSDLGCLRLASRISELKKDGYKISKRMIKVKNRYGESCTVAEYSLAEVRYDERRNFQSATN